MTFSRFIASGFLAVVTLCVFSAVALLGAPPERTDVVKEEYYRRLAELAPRDATAHYELALWCRSKNFLPEAESLLDSSIRIDPDHALAREARGFRPHGLGWQKAATKTNSARSRSGARKRQATTPSPKSADSGPKPDVAKKPQPSGTDYPALLAQKVDFAKKASETLKLDLNTKEDRDFLIHTSLSVSAPAVKELHSALLKVRREISSLIGGRSSTRIWPAKVQFFLLRSKSECVRFSETVDGQSFPVREGSYTKGQHTVLLRVDLPMLSRLLGETALLDYNSSRRRVNWWLSTGLSEWIASHFEEPPQPSYREAFEIVAAVLGDDTDAFHISDVIDSRRMGSATRISERARALTLVDFLIRRDRGRFQKFVAELKGNYAPEPPGDDADEESLGRFFNELVAFQTQALTDKYRQKLGNLDLMWKRHIQTVQQGFATSGSPKSRQRGSGRK